MFQFMFLKNANVWNFQLKMHQDIHFGNVVLMVRVIFAIISLLSNTTCIERRFWNRFSYNEHIHKFKWLKL